MSVPTFRPLILASSSSTRLALLEAAGLQVTAKPAPVDEQAIRVAMLAEQASARDIADTLAEMKARKRAERAPGALVLGCDQVLECQGHIWGKPDTPADAKIQLRALRAVQHSLYSAIVLYDDARPIWRHVGIATLTMRPFSDLWLDGYVDRNWDQIRHSAGAYQIEAEGIRLFSHIEGDHFTILGLPLIPLLNYLADRGFMDV